MSDDKSDKYDNPIIDQPNNYIKERKKYFKSHKCSVRHLKSKYDIKCSRITRFFLDITAINFNDVRARTMFKSYASLCAERHRQFTDHPFVLHPFSKLRFWGEIAVYLDLVTLATLEPLWVASRMPSKTDALHIVFLYTHILFVAMNMPLNMFTGFVAGKNKQYVELDHLQILKNYLFTWFIVDFIHLCCVLTERMADQIDSYTYFIRIFSAIFAIEYCVMLKYSNNICTVLGFDMITKTAIQLLTYLAIFLSWNILIQFVVEYYIEGSYNPERPRATSWMTIADLWGKPGHVKLMYSMTRAVAMLRKNSKYHLLLYDGDFEIFASFSFILAQCIILHCSFKYMLALFGTTSAKAKYYMMSQQVETYMNQRRFPPRIKKKIHKFYSIRYRSHFFVESTMLDCVSGQLHEDIIMHTGRHMVRDVVFLKHIPWAVLIEISLKFQLAIYIEGEIIYKINDIGNHMYFISKGTVASYTESGCELPHLEDGEYFGEVALMTEHITRYLTVVAVSNCELFTLSRKDFEIIERYRTAYDALRKVCANRRQYAMVMDDQFKAQLREQNKAMERELSKKKGS